MTRSTQSTDPSIRVSGLHKTYFPRGARARLRAVEALRGVDLTIDAPGFYAVMGRSGSGKSTLLHLLAGLDRPDSGEIWVGSQAVHAMPERDLVLYRRKSIGIVFQQFNLLPTLDALGNTILPGVLDGAERGAVESRGRALLEELDLGSRMHHRPEALSGGEQQRVAIARALLFEPRLILADEPTGSLDSASSERLWSLLESMARARGIIVLMVTHESVAAAHCDRTFVLSDGRVSGEFNSHGLDAASLASRASDLAR
ncbi:MAG: ABC transporter ATP-binding protein [Phycisphaerales bacterium]|nr:ABC transporter ATP-binding protein [Phycisphaerales bacterium]